MTEEEKSQSQEPALFTPQVRRLWHNNTWYYSIVDIISILLPASKDAGVYWRVLKTRLKEEGANETLDQIESLKLKATDGRFRLTDTASRETLLRIIQAVPSPRADPIKRWLAQVGEERLEEIEHPETAIERVKAAYRSKGYDDSWINERIKNDIIRNELTDEWKLRGAAGIDYSILTNEITKGTFDLSVQAYKRYKMLPERANLRDHMDILELALCSLSEATAVTLHRTRESQGFPELKRDATDAGKVGGEARKSVENTIDAPVVKPTNFLHLSSQKKSGRKLPASSQPDPDDHPQQGTLW